ncbi:hypothetical protein LTR53_015359, partial [Teratosphaeriaceae sp. CCFEE 6253]
HPPPASFLNDFLHALFIALGCTAVALFVIFVVYYAVHGCLLRRRLRRAGYQWIRVQPGEIGSEDMDDEGWELRAPPPAYDVEMGELVPRYEAVEAVPPPEYVEVA